MAETTKKLGLIKPASTDYYNIEDFNKNADEIDAFAEETAAALAKKENKSTTATATLLASGWSEDGKMFTQTVTVEGINVIKTVLVGPHPDNNAEYNEAGAYCSGQDTDTLTFKASKVSEVDLIANIVVLGG